MLDSEQKELLETNKQNISNFILDNQIDAKIQNNINAKIRNSQSGTEIQPETKLEQLDYVKKVSSIYKELLGREPDIGGLKHYSNQLKYNIIEEEGLRNIIKNSQEYRDNLNKLKSQQPQLVYCMIGGNRINEIKPYLETVLPYVDKLIYVDSYSTDGSFDYIKTLDSNKVVLIQKEWQDRFSEFRNYYMEYLQSTNYEGWIITSDTDEHFPLETLSQLRNLIDISSKEEYSGIQFRVEDISVDDDDRNKIISKTINNYWKSLMFKYHPALHYEGEPHETLIGHNIKWKETNLIYQHIRSKLHVYVRACLSPESIILSSDGLKEIKDICINDLVYSHDGKFHKVDNIIKREINEKIYEIKPHKGLPIKITGNHRVLSIKTKQCNKVSKTMNYPCRKNRKLSDCETCNNKYYEDYKVEWSPVEELSNNDILVFPKPKPNIYKMDDINNIRIDENLIRLIGYWLAEGDVYIKEPMSEFQIKFSLNKKDKFIKDIKETVSIKFDKNATETINGNNLRLSFRHKQFAKYLDSTFGKGASTKHIPPEFLGLEINYIENLLKGMIYGDGTENEDYQYSNLNTTSKSIAQFTYLSLIRLGFCPSILVAENQKEKYGSFGNKTQYRITLYRNKDLKKLNAITLSNKVKEISSPSTNMYYDDNNYVYMKIQSISKIEYKGEVYNLEVEGSETYCSPMITLHNCENFYISNSNRYSDKWAEFRFLCTKNNLLSFKEFYKLFEKHNLPKEIEDWIYQHRDDNQDSGDSEVREMAILYNDILPKRNSKKTPVDTKDFAERLQSSVDAKNLAERLLATTTGKILKTPETPPSIPETLKIPQPAIPVITIPSVDIQINTGTNERPFYFIHQECEHCSATINLKELIINDKCNLTLCKDCWLNLVNTIHAEYKIPTK